MALYVRWRALKEGTQKPIFLPRDFAGEPVRNDENVDPLESESAYLTKQQEKLKQQVRVMQEAFLKVDEPFRVEELALLRILIRDQVKECFRREIGMRLRLAAK